MGDLIKVVFDSPPYFNPFEIYTLPTTLTDVRAYLTVLLEFNEVWGGSTAASLDNLHREAKLQFIPGKHDTPHDGIAKIDEYNVMFVWESSCGENQLQFSRVSTLSDELFKRYLRALADGNMRGYLSVMVFSNGGKRGRQGHESQS